MSDSGGLVSAVSDRGRVIQLPGEYSLRRADENTWWLQVLGMDILEVRTPVPCGPGGDVASEVEEFAQAIASRHGSEADALRAEVKRLEAVLRGAESAICDLHQEREALRAEVARREADESAWRRTAAILREENAAHWQVKERLEAAREDDQKRAAAMMLDIGNKWVDALEEKKAEIVRLREAFVIFADEAFWRAVDDGRSDWWAWIGDGEPWKMAQEALAAVAMAQEK